MTNTLSGLARPTFTPSDTLAATLEYFGGDELAASTAVNKYLLKKVVEGGIAFDEDTPASMHGRLAREIALIDCCYEFGREVRTTIEITADSEKAYYEDRYLTYFEAFDRFAQVVPQGSPMYGIGNPHVLTSISNCVVTPSPADDVSGIIGHSSQELANLFKRRCGVGIDISTLRPEGTPVNNSAVTSTGAWSFADHFSNVCRMIGQNGRRGALMITLDVRHPDVDRFVTMKRDLTRVTGANISLRLTDGFMEAVVGGEDWICRWPTEDYDGEKFSQKGTNVDDVLALGGKWVAVEPDASKGIHVGYELWRSSVPGYKGAYLKKFKASELWHLINESAVLSAEPGLLFWDNYLANLPAHCYPDFKTICVNPCVTADTWVTTSLGARQVGDLIGEQFEAVVDGKVYPSSPHGFVYTGHKEVFRVETDRGYTVSATANHRVLVEERAFGENPTRVWREIADLKNGDHMVLQNHAGLEYGGKGTREEGRMCGNMLPTEVFDRYSAIVAADRVSHEFFIAERESSEFVAGFLNGLFAAHGAIVLGEGMRLYSASKEVLRAVQRMLSRLGVMSSVGVYQAWFEPKPEITTTNTVMDYSPFSSDHTNFHWLSVCWRNISVFSERVGLSHPDKRSLLRDMSGSYMDTWKGEDERFTAKVIGVVSTGIEDVYDCNIPGIHAFDANGLYVHNCAEIGLSAYDSCRLTSINLKGFVRDAFRDNASFDFAEFDCKVRLAMRVMDDIVDLEARYLGNIIEKVDEVDEKILWGKLRTAALQGRRTGLGTHALADALACLGLKYDSDEAISMVDDIFRAFRDSAYDESVNLAIERGPFPAFDWELEKDCAFIKRLPEALRERIRVHGRRNISLLTMAPTGSVSIVSQTSSGVEPVFSNYYMRRKKINPSDPDARVDFVDQNGDKWAEFAVYHHNIMGYMETNPEASAKIDVIMNDVEISKRSAEIAKVLPDYFVTAPEIDAMRRVKVQGTIQQYIDHGISSCLAAGESLILTDKGMLDISELAGHAAVDKFSPMLKEIASVNCNNAIGQITEAYNNGVKPTKVITSDNGQEIVCTPNHRLQVMSVGRERVWKRADEITVGDMLVGRIGLNLWNRDASTSDLATLVGSSFECPHPNGDSFDGDPMTIPTHMTEELAYLMGHIRADGCIGTTGMYFRPEKCSTSWMACGIIRTHVKSLFGLDDLREDDGAYSNETVAFCSRSLASFFLWLVPREAEIPLAIRRSSREHVKQFFKGASRYADSGDRKIAAVSFCLEKFARQAQQILINMGTESHLSSVEDDRWVLRMENNDYARFLSEPSERFYPKSGRHFARIKAANKSAGLPADVTYVLRAVTDVSDGPNSQTYDVSVPDANSYVANGIVSHNTINLPKGTSVEECATIYEASWRAGLKGVTVYVDGSRSGVLVNMSEKVDANAIQPSDAPKRPASLPCEIHRHVIDGKKWTIMVGLLSGSPFEIFGGLSENVVVPRKIFTGSILKRKTEKATVKGRNSAYDLVVGDEEDPFVVKDIVGQFDDGDYAAQTRTISLALRHGVGAHFIADQLGRDKDASFFSFSKVMARVLKKYIKDGVSSAESCGVCGAKLVFQDGCSSCISCGGTNKCG